MRMNFEYSFNEQVRSRIYLLLKLCLSYKYNNVILFIISFIAIFSWFPLDCVKSQSWSICARESYIYNLIWTLSSFPF